MKIEGNQKELDAMVEFHKGNRVEGLRLQEEFAAEFRKIHPAAGGGHAGRGGKRRAFGQSGAGRPAGQPV